MWSGHAAFLLTPQGEWSSIHMEQRFYPSGGSNYTEVIFLGVRPPSTLKFTKNTKVDSTSFLNPEFANLLLKTEQINHNSWVIAFMSDFAEDRTGKYLPWIYSLSLPSVIYPDFHIFLMSLIWRNFVLDILFTIAFNLKMQWLCHKLQSSCNVIL